MPATESELINLVKENMHLLMFLLIIAGPRQLGELTQMLNFVSRLLGRALRFVFALRLLRRAQIFDERVELVSPRAGSVP